MTGATIFGLTYQQVFPQISKLANLGSVVIPDLWRLDPFLTVLAFVLLSLMVFYMIDRAGWHRQDSAAQQQNLEE